MQRRDLDELRGTTWTGNAELWLDPLGNDVQQSACSLRFDAEGARYTWQHEGKTHEGVFALGNDGATWSDSWHQVKPVKCTALKDTWGLFALHYTYGAGEGPDWGWRTVLSRRPGGELVLQMTNIAPWGEEARAVRMVLTRQA